MRRISIWVLSTLSILVLLFGYSTSTSGPLATRAQSSIQSSPSVSSSSGSGGSGTSGSGTTGAGKGSTSSRSTSPAKQTVTGSVAQTLWGPVQVQLTMSGGKITKATVVQYPNGNGKEQEINSYALPILTQETVDSQNANIDMVSGATETSNGYVESLQSALDQAGL